MAWRRCVACLTTLCMVSCMGRFYTKKQITPDELTKHPEPHIHSVITVDGDAVEFEPPALLQDSVVIGCVKDGTPMEIPLSRVYKLEVRKVDEAKMLACCAAGSLGAILGTVLGIWLVILIESNN